MEILPVEVVEEEMMLSLSKTIVVGTRDSNLSRAQVEEVYAEFSTFHPDITFSPLYIKTTGDRDKETSLRSLDKTDFFTKEIDQLLLEKKCHIGIHSAKDLPEPIPQGLKVVALTKGVDARDVIVFRDGENLFSGARIATSSLRREECVKKLALTSLPHTEEEGVLCEKCGKGPHIHFVDIRGTIEERLEMLFKKEVDGVVIAESALIRLNKTHLNRVYLEGETAPLQGRLAVVAREEDIEMELLFYLVHEEAAGAC